MPVLNFSYATIKNADKFQAYVKAAAELMADMNVEVVVRGQYSETYRGEEKSAHIAAIFRYPDMETAKGFYTSKRYEPLIPLRDEACDMTIHFYEE